MGDKGCFKSLPPELVLIAVALLGKSLLIYLVYLNQPLVVDFIQSNKTSIGVDMPHTKNLVNESNNPLLYGLCCHHDSGHYLNIAERGYFKEVLYAFPPGYPLLVRALSPVIDIKLAGLLVSNFFHLLSILLFYHVALIYLSREKAFSATVFYALFPFNLVYGTVAFSEPVFLSLALTSWIYFERKSYLSCGLLIALASSVRYTGILLYPLMSLLYVIKSRRARDSKPLKNLFKLNSTAILPLAWLWLYLPSIGVDFSMVQWKYFHARVSLPFLFYIRFLTSFGGLSSTIKYAIPVAFIYLFFIIPNARGLRKRPLLSIYSLPLILFYSTLTGTASLSYPRFLGTIWPTYILLADQIEKKTLILFYAVASFVLAVVALTLHASWIFIA